MKKMLVIGAVAAGTSAASKARRVDPEMEIKVFAEGENISYGACGLPYFIGGTMAKEKLLVRSIADFAGQGIEVRNLCQATEIKPGEKKVVFRDLSANRWFEEHYDQLVVATGARPMVLDCPNNNLPGIFTLRTVADGMAVKGYLEQRRPANVLIAGAGYIGLEMAEVLSHLGYSVTLAERGPQVAPNMDPDMAAKVQKDLEQQGVKVLVDTEIIGFAGKETVQRAFTRSGSFPADLVLVAIGVRPNTGLASAAGIELGIANAIKVNPRMETNLEGVYAAGDCATAHHLVTGKDVYIPMGTTANKQGRVAGENAAGGNEIFRGVLGTGIARIFDLEISRTGFTDKECQANGIDFRSHTVECRTAALPALAGPIWLKLTVSPADDRLLGAQIVGRGGAGKRIDVIAAAITMGARLEDIYDMDLAYSPPFSPVWDPVLVALNKFR
ncbi:MAG: FAD-dependent oxidoreductase [Syntrophomonadaceae bacterium]